MKKRLFGKVAFTASTLRRTVTVVAVLLLGTGVSAVVLTRPLTNKQQEPIINPINPNQTHEQHFNDINLDDLLNEDEKEDQVIQNQIPSQQQTTTGGDSGSSGTGGGDNPSPAPAPSKAPGSIKTVPGFIVAAGPVQYNSANSYTLITTEGESDTGVMKYYITTDTDTPNKDSFKEFANIGSLNVVKNPGTYSAYYFSEGDDSHEDTTIEKLGTFVIEGNSTTITTYPSVKEALTYNNQLQSLVQNVGSSANGTAYFSVNNSSIIKPAKDTFVPSSSNDVKRKEEGTYHVWYYFKGKDGYEDTAITYLGESTITKLSVVVTTTPTGNTLSYINGVSQVLTNGASALYGTPMYALGTSSAPTEAYSAELPRASAVGDYYIWWYVDGGEIYTGTDPECITASIEAVVLPKATFTAPTVKYGLTANGTNQPLINAGSSTNGTMKYSIGTQDQAGNNWTEDASSVTGKDAGTYYVWYYAKGDDINFSNSDEAKKVVTIFPSDKKAEITEAPTAKDSVYYNGSLQEITTGGSANPLGLMYATNTDSLNAPEKSEFKSDGNKAKDAGTYYVWYYAKGDGVEYGDSDICTTPIEATIAKPQAKFLSEPEQTHFYFEDGEPGNLCIAGNTNDGTIKYGVTATSSIEPVQYTTSVPTAAAVGTYYVWYYIEGDDNHSNTEKKYVVSTIDKSNISLINAFSTEPTLITGQEYEGTPVQIVNPGELRANYGTIGTVMYWATKSDIDDEYIQGLDKTVFSADPAKANSSGYYSVYYYVKGDANHEDSNIARAKLTGSDGYWVYVNGELEIYGPIPAMITSPNDYYDGFGFPYTLLWTYPDDYITEEGVDLTNKYAAIYPNDTSSTETFTIYYAATTTYDKPSKSTFTTNVPTASEPGTYYVWYYGKSSIGSSRDTEIDVVISTVKDLPTIIKEPSFKESSTTMTTSTISPVIPGVVEHGTMMYYLEEVQSGGDGPRPGPLSAPSEPIAPPTALFSSTVPTVNKPGRYKLWFYVKGDENYLDTNAVCVTNESGFDYIFTAEKQATIITHPQLKPGLEENTLVYGETDNTVFVKHAVYDTGSLGRIGYFCIDNIEDPNDLLLNDSALINKYDDAGKIKYSNNMLIGESAFYDSPGTYTFCYFWSPGLDAGCGYFTSVVSKITFTIKKPLPVYKNTPTLATDKVRDGSSFNLIEDGARSTPGVEIVYIALKTEIGGEKPATPDRSQIMLSAGGLCSSDIGTYHIWYTTIENDKFAAQEITYAGSVTINSDGSDTGIVFTDPTPVTGISYDGSPRLLINFGSVDEDQGEFRYYVSQDSESRFDAYPNGFTTDAPIATNPGKYWITYYVKGKGGRQDSYPNTLIVEIAKKSQSLDTLATSFSFTEDGQYHPLIITEPTSSGNTAAEYYVSTSSAEPNESAVWTSIEGTKQRDPGVYYIWYRCKETSYYFASDYEYVTATIKGRGKINEEPTFINPFSLSSTATTIGGVTVTSSASYFYQGSDIEILSAGSSVTGTMKYKLVAGETPSVPNKTDIVDNTIPTVSDPGTYYIFYYSKSNSSLYEDSEVKAVKVIVNKGRITLLTKPVVNGATSSFDGNLTVYTKEYSDSRTVLTRATCSVGGTVRYALWNSSTEFDIKYNSSKYKPISEFSNEYLKDPLVPGDYYIGYYISNDDNNLYTVTEHGYDDIDNSIIKITITKADPNLIAPALIGDSDNDGALVSLLTEPATTDSNGTIHYALTTANSTTAPAKDSSLYTTTYSDIKAKDPTRYKVWYYIDETDYYKGTEPDFVMIRLIGNVVPTVSSTNPHVDWMQLPPTPGSQITGELQDVELVTINGLQPDDHLYLAVDDEPITDKTSITSEAIPTAQKPGTYCVSYYYVVDGVESDIHSIYVDMDYDPSYLGMISEPILTNFGTIPYDGDNWNPIDTYANDDDEGVYDFVYYVTTSPETPDFNSIIWSANTLPPFECKNPGNYYIWWKAVDKTEFMSDPGRRYIKGTEPECLTFTITKGIPYFDVQPEPAAYPITYTATERKLSKVGTPYTNLGEELDVMYYGRSKNDTTPVDKSKFSTAIPKATLPGTYTVFYYIKGNLNYDDSPISSFDVTIQAAPASFNNLSIIPNVPYNKNGVKIAYFESREVGVEGKLCDRDADNERYKAMFALGDASTPPDPLYYSDEIPTVYLPGTYYLWWYVIDTRFGVNAVVKDVELCDPAVVVKSQDSFPSLLFASKVDYTGSNIDLLASDPDNDPTILDELDGREYLYYVYYSEDAILYPEDTPHENEGLFTLQKPKANMPGYYVVWYTTAETDKYKANVYLCSDTIKVVVSADTIYPKGFTDVKSSSDVKELVYNGEPQSLLKVAGTSPSGTFYYAEPILKQMNQNPQVDPDELEYIYTNSNPPKRTLSGVYRVYYKLKYNNGSWGNGGYIESHMYSLSSEILHKLVLQGEETSGVIAIPNGDGTYSDQTVIVNKVTYNGEPAAFIKTPALGDKTGLETVTKADDGVVAYYVSDKALTSDELLKLLSLFTKPSSLSKLRFVENDLDYLLSTDPDHLGPLTSVIRKMIVQNTFPPGTTYESLSDDQKASVDNGFIQALQNKIIAPNTTFYDLFVDINDFTVEEPGTYAIYSVLIPDDYMITLVSGENQSPEYAPENASSVDCQYFVVEKDPCEVTSHPVAKNNLIYNNGVPMELLTGDGTCENGSIKYFVSRIEYTGEEMQSLNKQGNGIVWTDYTSPSDIVGGLPVCNVKGGNAGKYYIYYYGKGSGKYGNTEIYCVEAEISGEAPVIKAPHIEPYYEYTYYNYDYYTGIGYIPFTTFIYDESELLIDTQPQMGLTGDDKASATFKGKQEEAYYLITPSSTLSVIHANFADEKNHVKVSDALLDTLYNDESGYYEFLPGEYKLWYYFQFDIDTGHQGSDNRVLTNPECVSFTVGKADLYLREPIELMPLEERFVNEESYAPDYNNFIDEGGDASRGGIVYYCIQNSPYQDDFIDFDISDSDFFKTDIYDLDAGFAEMGKDLYYRLSYYIAPDVKRDPLNARKFNTTEMYHLDYKVEFKSKLDDPESLVLPQLKATSFDCIGGRFNPFTDGTPEAGWTFYYHFSKDSRDPSAIFPDNKILLNQFGPIDDSEYNIINEPGIYYAYVLAFNTYSIQQNQRTGGGTPYHVYPHVAGDKSTPILTKYTFVVNKGEVKFDVMPEAIEDIEYDPNNMIPELDILKPGTCVTNMSRNVIDIKYYVQCADKPIASTQDMWMGSSPLMYDYDIQGYTGLFINYEPGEYYIYIMVDVTDSKIADDVQPFLAFKYTIRKQKPILSGSLEIVDNPSINVFLLDEDSSLSLSIQPGPGSGSLYVAVTNVNQVPDISEFKEVDPISVPPTPSVSVPGQYYLWYCFKSFSPYIDDSDIKCVPFTVLGSTGYVVPDVYTDEIECDGTVHPLIRSGFKVYDEGGNEITNDTGIKVLYGITSSANDYPVTYLENINDTGLTVKEGGEYYLHYKVTKNGDIYIDDQYIKFDVKFAQIPFTAPTPSANLTIGSDGQPIKLINEGSCSITDSQMRYYVSTIVDDEPSNPMLFAEASDAGLYVSQPGTYYVWYICIPPLITQYRHSDPQVLEITVTKSQAPVSNVMEPQGITITSNHFYLGVDSLVFIKEGFEEGYQFEYLMDDVSSDNSQTDSGGRPIGKSEATYAVPDIEKITQEVADGIKSFSTNPPVISNDHPNGSRVIYWRKMNLSTGEYSSIHYVISYRVSGSQSVVQIEPTFKDLDYTGEEQQLCTYVGPDFNDHLQFALTEEYCTHTEVNNSSVVDEYTLGPEYTEYSPTIPTASRPGTYYVWYRNVTSSGLFGGTLGGVKPIGNKKTYHQPYYAIVVIRADGTASIGDPLTLKSDTFTYEGSELLLSDMIDSLPTMQNGSSILYGVRLASLPLENRGDIQFTFDPEFVRINSAGNYNIYYFVAGDNGYSDSELYSIPITVNAPDTVQAEIRTHPHFSPGFEQDLSGAYNPWVVNYMQVNEDTGKGTLLEGDECGVIDNGELYVWFAQKDDPETLPITVPPSKDEFVKHTSTIEVECYGDNEYGVVWYYAKGVNGASDSNMYFVKFEINYPSPVIG